MVGKRTGTERPSGFISEEYKKLYELALADPNRGQRATWKSTLADRMENTGFDDIKIQIELTKLETEILFCPLYKVPLYINDDDDRTFDDTALIARWRLSLGK